MKIRNSNLIMILDTYKGKKYFSLREGFYKNG